MKVTVLPFELKEEEIALLSAIPFQLQILEAEIVPPHAYNPHRGQYLAKTFLEVCGKKEGKVVLGVANVDLYAQGLNFVFGEAELGGRCAVISIYRLRSEDRALFRARIQKEAVHEIGHVLGLRHCPNPLCVMHFSNSLHDTDIKAGWFCKRCSVLLPNINALE